MILLLHVFLGVGIARLGQAHLPQSSPFLNGGSEAYVWLEFRRGQIGDWKKAQT